MNKSDLLAARNVRYRRRMDLRVTTPEQAVKFIDDVGFAFLFPIQDAEMPSLWDAIAGRVLKVYPHHHGYEIERTWGWKDASLNQRWWHYGKLLRSKATLVSLAFLPNFYAMSRNYGDYEHDYLDEYREGLLSAEAKTIYEALLRHGALDAVKLRRAVHMSSDASKARFERALTQLQVGLKVLPVGIAAAGAWRYAFIYEILPRWFPSITEKARDITVTQAHCAIFNQYVQNVVATTIEAAAKALSWSLADTRQTAALLAEQKRVTLDTKISGIKELQVVAVEKQEE